MASYNSVMPTVASRSVFATSAPMVESQAPAGTFAPGTKIQVGSQKVVIQKYFAEGGFAHVYLVRMPKPIDGTDTAVLKRVAVPDKEHLASMRTEVETMKKLKGHRPIVKYYDSHASQLKGGGYEVFLLMEFCDGGGLINFMNTRLQNRLTEPEILNIFSDVAEGVACMHYLKPPLLHRDLKVENVLITTKGGMKKFKLCDFGSTAPPRPAATTTAECRAIDEDVQKHTTLQYRSPEMVDVYRKLPIDEKSDIWALGVLLYKLCYYTTPFEAQGQLAILNASFKFPAYPQFSEKLKQLTALMLRESPKLRPNIYQVLREVCIMQGIEVPIKDIYSGKINPESSRKQTTSTPDQVSTSPPTVGAVFSPSPPQQAIIPEIIPMRRGRPATGQIQKSNSSITIGKSVDPWGTLDSNSTVIDEVSTRFPSLDQFSLLHDGGTFDFDKNLSQGSQDLGQRVTEKLADDAFATQPKSSISRAQKIISSNPELQAASSAASSSATCQQPSTLTQSKSPKLTYVSQGTMTSSLPTNLTSTYPSGTISTDLHRSSSLVLKQEIQQNDLTEGSIQEILLPLSDSTRHASPYPSSSTEINHKPFDDFPSRTLSINSQKRSLRPHVESNIEFLREKEISNRANSLITPQSRPKSVNSSSSEDVFRASLETETSCLHQTEEPRVEIKSRRRLSATKIKRTSLPSLAGTKTLLVGKFGDAFKRFEQNANYPTASGHSRPLSPLNKNEHERRDLISTSEYDAIPDEKFSSRLVDDDLSQDLLDDNLSPEQRREVERRRLSIEEKRVADAAAEYRKKLAERDRSREPSKNVGGVSRAMSIQKKVRSLLNENQGIPSPSRKVTTGHGQYSEPEIAFPPADNVNPYTSFVGSCLLKKDVTKSSTPPTISKDFISSKAQPSSFVSATSTSAKINAPRPNAPPKPIHLNRSGVVIQAHQRNYPQPSVLRPSRSDIDQLVDEREKDYLNQPIGKEDYINEFSKRFPSLSGIEMVEREIDARPKERIRKGIGGKGDRAESNNFGRGGVDRASLRSKDV
ncbi:BgTH12-03763 [Blumeria graminis f. sp. triticale]|uniref:non-specific serine/threonine protein kinase n=1 Tax=Blumeria graminis f. sp. triticale TaxID=1689686 RepID=A0A9W4GDA8_BLUGR|nr:BgTH12-03763 [Blumeria graminis f. sp. triticale]